MKEKKGIYIFLAVLEGTLLILNLFFMIIVPPLIITGIFIGIMLYYTIKKIRNINKQNLKRKNTENNLLKAGYRKIHDDLFLDEENKKLNILGKEYQYSQIIDCELIEKTNAKTNSFGITNGKITRDGKIRATSFSTQTNYSSKSYLNITVEDFTNPNILLPIKEEVNNILSLFKLIIHQNNKWIYNFFAHLQKKM